MKKARKAKNKKPRIRFDLITIFPNIFDSYLKESLILRAVKNKIIEIKIHDIRRYAKGKHKKVDDKPFGGGPGMVLMAEPIYKAVESIKSKIASQKSRVRTILFSTRGKKLDTASALRLSKYKQLILISGRYEGVDERVATHIADEEISIGDYVLSGGELPSLVLIETVSRQIPGFLGKYESLENIKGSYPVFTQPEEFKPKKGRVWAVPEVLLSGHHKKIEEWRRGNSS